MDDKSPLKGAWLGSCDPFYIFGAPMISLERMKLESTNFVYRYRVGWMLALAWHIHTPIRETNYSYGRMVRVTWPFFY